MIVDDFDGRPGGAVAHDRERSRIRDRRRRRNRRGRDRSARRSAASTSSSSISRCRAPGGLKSIPRIIAAAARREGDDRLVARRRGRGADRRRTGARRRRHHAQARQRAASTADSPKSCSSKLKALGYASARAASAGRSRGAGSQPAACAPMPADPIDVLAIGASTGGIHALGVAVPGASQAHRRADPRHPASADPLHAGVRAPARRRRAARLLWSPRTGWRSQPDRILVAPGDAHLTLEPGERRRSRSADPRPQQQRLHAVGRSDARVGRRDLRRAARSASC